MYCCPLWFNTTSSIRMPYSVSEMFVSCGIPSFHELLRKCIFDFSERTSRNTNSVIEACLSPKVYMFAPIRQCMVTFSVILTINHFMSIILLLFPNTLH